MSPTRICQIAACAASLLIAAGGGLYNASAAARGRERRVVEQAPACQCNATVTRTITSGNVRACEPAGVTLTIRTTCAPQPLHVAFVLFETMSFTPSAEYSEAALAGLAMPRNPHVKAAVVWADEDSAFIRQSLSNRETDLKHYLCTFRLHLCKRCPWIGQAASASRKKCKHSAEGCA